MNWWEHAHTLLLLVNLFLIYIADIVIDTIMRL